MSRILGSGHYVPQRVVTNFDVMKMMETSDEFIVERTGVHAAATPRRRWLSRTWRCRPAGRGARARG